MKAFWQDRVSSMSARVSEYAPMVPACCNVCRVCTTTNVATLSTAGLLAAGAVAVRVGRRAVGGSTTSDPKGDRAEPGATQSASG